MRDLVALTACGGEVVEPGASIDRERSADAPVVLGVELRVQKLAVRDRPLVGLLERRDRAQQGVGKTDVRVECLAWIVVEAERAVEGRALLRGPRCMFDEDAKLDVMGVQDPGDRPIG